ncbi:MAG: hypothetical protein Q9192_008579, partial [Flavoplaca navasiana]
MAGALVLTIAPATAVLIIPQNQLWQAGGSPFYLQGTDSDIWPTVLTRDSNRDPPFCQSSASAGSPGNATEYAVCPSGGYKSLASHYSEVNVSTFLDGATTLPWVAERIVSSYFYEITSPRLEVPTQMTLGEIRVEGGGPDSFLVQPHAASIMFQEKLTIDWWHATHNETHNIPRNQARYRYYHDLTSKIQTQVPKAGVMCSLAQEVPTDTIVEIDFPTQPFKDRMSNRTTTKVPKYDPKSLPIRFAWTPLDPASYPNVTAGATIAFPGNDSALVVGCSVAAEWVEAEVIYGWPNYKFETGHINFASTRAISVEESWLNDLTPILNATGPTGDVV